MFAGNIHIDSQSLMCHSNKNSDKQTPYTDYYPNYPAETI